jgi:hypothetical protein
MLADALFVMPVEQSSRHILDDNATRRAHRVAKKGEDIPDSRPLFSFGPGTWRLAGKVPFNLCQLGADEDYCIERRESEVSFRGQSSREDDDGLLTGWWLYRMLTGGRTEVGQGLRGAARNVDQLCIRAPESDMRSGRSRRWRQMQERARGDRC